MSFTMLPAPSRFRCEYRSFDLPHLEIDDLVLDGRAVRAPALPREDRPVECAIVVRFENAILRHLGARGLRGVQRPDSPQAALVAPAENRLPDGAAGGGALASAAARRRLSCLEVPKAGSRHCARGCRCVRVSTRGPGGGGVNAPPIPCPPPPRRRPPRGTSTACPHRATCRSGSVIRSVATTSRSPAVA